MEGESDLKSSGCLLSRGRTEERSEAPGVSDQWRRKKRTGLLGGAARRHLILCIVHTTSA